MSIADCLAPLTRIPGYNVKQRDTASTRYGTAVGCSRGAASLHCYAVCGTGITDRICNGGTPCLFRATGERVQRAAAWVPGARLSFQEDKSETESEMQQRQ